MNARLGFAIAAHLEPEVLIVDEVLSVGDFAFQQRAYERLQEMVNHDVTTIIVSHQLERIASLCKRAVLLRQGEVAHAGPAAETIAAYVSGSTDGRMHGPADAPLVIRSVELLTDGRNRLRRPSHAARRGSTSSIRTGSTRPRASACACDRCRTARCCSATSSIEHGVSLEGLTHVTLDIGLQLNTRSGVYTIETSSSSGGTAG